MLERLSRSCCHNSVVNFAGSKRNLKANCFLVITQFVDFTVTALNTEEYIWQINWIFDGFFTWVKIPFKPVQFVQHIFEKSSKK